jgi:mannose-6-phosphate isomerase
VPRVPNPERVNGTADNAPLVLVPKLTEAIWGGDALVKTYGKPGATDAKLGESWECWDDNTVASGPYAGETLAAVRARMGRVLTGPVDPAKRFPVLTKIIDARQALSVQVHPGDAYAQRVEHQPVGKTECWYVLGAEPGAELVLGWTRDIDRAEYERRVADGTLGDVLRRVRVTPGEAYYLPAGTLHAIGAGIQLFETQQASDLTYRIFDWNRTGDDGKPRQLHVAKAADVLDFRATLPGAVTQLTFEAGGVERTIAIADRRFVVERVRITQPGAILGTSSRPVAILAMNGPLELAAPDGTVTTLQAWQTAVLPAAAGRAVFAQTGEALVVRIDPDLAKLREAATARGVAAGVVDAFLGQFTGASAPA